MQGVAPEGPVAGVAAQSVLHERQNDSARSVNKRRRGQLQVNRLFSCPLLCGADGNYRTASEGFIAAYLFGIQIDIILKIMQP